jgi:hypothetical protein
VKAVRASDTRSLWPSVEELVPPELPPDIAVARLVALARSLLVENRELRDALALTRAASTDDLVRALHPPSTHDREADVA